MTRLRLTSRRVALLGAMALMLSVLSAAQPAMATPGWAHGNDMWFKPGSTHTNGTLYAYRNDSVYTSMTAGSGLSNSYSVCTSDKGRLPNGWYSSAYDHHVNNKNGTSIDGRVWGLTDKDCGNGTIRWGLFIHSEETVSNGQSCPTSGDDKHCWESAAWDYRSNGCVKISHPNNGFPNSVQSLNLWWGTKVGGGHGVYYSRILWVGSSAPPAPPS